MSNVLHTTHTISPGSTAPIVIRTARESDRPAVARLAQLDTTQAPPGTMRLAEVDDQIVAGLAIESGHAIADPFRRTADAVELLRSRARQIGLRSRRRPRIAARSPERSPGIARRAA